MYKQLQEKTDFLDYLISKGSQTILNVDRELYRNVFARIESFCAERNIIVTEPKVYMMPASDRQLTPKDYAFDILSENPMKDARDIADSIYETHAPHLNKELIYVETNIKNMEFTIYLAGRLIAKVHRLNRYGQTSLSRIMNLIECPKLFGSVDVTIKFIDPLLLLIDIYRKMASSPKADASLLEFESLAYQRFVIGKSMKRPKFGIDADFKKVRKIRNCSFAIVGDYASHTPVGGEPRLQMIIDGTVDEFKTKLKSAFDCNFEVIERSLEIPSDFQIKKYIFQNTKTGAAIDVFNSGQYDMVPYSELGEVKIANIFLLARFRLIDIWSLQIVEKLGGKVGKRIEHILGSFLVLRQMIHELLVNNPQTAIQENKFMGHCVDEYVAKKKLIREQKDRFPKYFPGGKVN